MGFPLTQFGYAVNNIQLTEINVNDYVWVRLTAHGQELYSHTPCFEFRSVSSGWTRFQLWNLMFIFGSNMLMGGAPVFRDNIIRFTDPALES